MIRHIVWWTLKPHTGEQTADDNANFILNASAELQGGPHAESVEVSAKVQSSTTVPAKVVLQATFKDKAAMQAYLDDPVHKRFADMVAERATSRNCIDYEVLPNLG